MSFGSSKKVGFSAARLGRLSEIERWHFWFVGRRTLVHRLVEQYLDRSMALLDVGCGTGHLLEELTQQGYRIAGLDLRPEGLRSTRKDLPAAFLVQAEATRLPLAAETFEAVLMLDVMEHVEDGTLLREVAGILKPGGIVILTVPALPWLWSYRDTAAGHLRRYTRKGLSRVLVAAGFGIREIHYYQCLLLPFAILTRLLGKKDGTLRDLEDQPAPMLNNLFLQISNLEVSLGKVFHWPVGSTLVAVCQK